eukprot:CAMPEP_0116027262 /NCGR_PEP_ID=MMETSP0321-20121206/14507_1 /TAXON_ID=163516 /ORGANISM="Leptocylindrus danicus var. danicus, Strain B650" /LENGTH=417 /DNA_ID=CAMNT_0003500549 /DNA_START=28 /DNA_END=1281 /DNA_ORIENTATION=-
MGKKPKTPKKRSNSAVKVTPKRRKEEPVLKEQELESTSSSDEEEIITEEMIEELRQKVAERLSSGDEASDDNMEEEDDDDVDQEEKSATEEEDNEAAAADEIQEVELSASEEEEEEEDEAPTLVEMQPSDGKYRNKQRCLMIASRGVTSRYRHLLEDLRTLVPHHKKDSKLDVKHGDNGGVGRAVNEIANIKSCNTVVFLECRKRGQDAYLWMGYTSTAAATNPGVNSNGGPSAKFHVSNVHTMDELRMTGNCMKGSRPILTFDDSFDSLDHLKMLKVMFVDVFGTPRGHPKSKPFVDRVMGFYYVDGKIWLRNYQILEEQAANAKEAAEKKQGGLNTQLVEIGPRFVLDPIRIFGGSFGGPTLYQNKDFVSPNVKRAERKRGKGKMYEDRKRAQESRKIRNENIVVPADPLDSVFR